MSDIPVNGMPQNEVQPQPMPFTYKVGIAKMMDGTEMVVVHLLMVTGTTTLFLAKDFANQMGDHLKKNASGIALEVAKTIPIGGIEGMDDFLKKIKGKEQ